ncbi:ADP-ribose pyrophosphatase [Alteromonas sp. KC3]|uniref:NUDIX domain-containing protein n=1 Tax=unclassified Alteromonas TaxID=2614992 RepID=UPI0019247597|nr:MULTISPECIES: NUDIX hydrolase [unclassified Alteromonas]BCO18566.1 ADP-ribose pyrophosphatase [Alteromonas sp. KC3]BCO22527.1 ADP-ribose pyrophosphatase [Alteromonas sp. KC14]
MADIETLDSKVVYQNKWLTVREDKIRRKSGNEGIYGVVEKPDFAIILPIENDVVYMVEQYRYTIGERQLEFPQGAWEANPDADPAELAAGELKEETGLSATQMIYVGFQYLAYGFCNQGYHIYVAKGLSQGEQKLDVEEEDLRIVPLALNELREKILSGEIKDASTCNAVGLATLKGHI